MAAKDGLATFINQSKEFTEKDRPELRLQPDNIEEFYDKTKATLPVLLNPNGYKISLIPCGAREFKLLDESGVCIIVQKW